MKGAMMNRYFKISLCLILAITVILSASVSFGAESNNDINFEILTDTTELCDNSVLFYTYNVPENYTGQAELTDTKTAVKTVVMGKDCIETPLVIETTSGAEYKYTTSGGGGQILNFDNTGGVYRKMRLKLSYSPYFNEDGSHTTDVYTYHFSGTEYVGRDYYFSSLVIVSGGAINFVTPDKNGYVEFYACTNVDTTVHFSTSFQYERYTETSFEHGAGGGVSGCRINEFTKGVLDNKSTVSINSATIIQRYLAKELEFGKMQEYQADVDNDYRISIMDATKIQRYLVKEVLK